MRRRRAAAGLVALILAGLPVGAQGSRIGMPERGAGESTELAELVEAAETGPEAKGPELLASSEAHAQHTRELRESILARLRCMRFQRGFGQEPGAERAPGESSLSETELAALFKPPEVYRSGVDAERLRALAARVAGTDPSGALDGSRATVKGLPSPLAVSGWGSRSTPLVAYFPRAETPLNLERDLSGAGVLVVDGDLRVWRSFHYAGLLVVLGDLVVMGEAEVFVDGLPLFSGELRVLHGGDFSVRARKSDFRPIYRALGAWLPPGQIPLPRIERVKAPTEEEEEENCAVLAPGM